jgi:uncharacterized protein YndB with AHSA1/START domain
MSEYGVRVDAHTVRFERLLPGPIERVWEYLVDSDKRGEWFARGPLPAKVGETFELRFKHSELSPNQAEPPARFAEMDKTGASGREVLLAIEPPHRLVFSFGHEDEQASEVEIRLLPVDGDTVRLVLTHSRIPDRAYALNISGGWHSHLEMLQYKVEGRVPPAFWDVWRGIEDAYDKRYT